MPRSATQLDAGKRGLNMNFDHEELTLMMLYNTGTRMGLVHELRPVSYTHLDVYKRQKRRNVAYEQEKVHQAAGPVPALAGDWAGCDQSWRGMAAGRG